MIKEQADWVRQKIDKEILQFNNYGVELEETEQLKHFREYLKSIPKGGFTDVDRLVKLFQDHKTSWWRMKYELIMNKLQVVLGKSSDPYKYKPRIK